MALPLATRRNETSSNLEYAQARHKHLMDELFTAKSENRSPEFLAHSASEIISVTRECFDYLGKDIIEGHVLPVNQKVRGRYDAGKLRVYFPFKADSLERSDSPFLHLKESYPPLHRDLANFIRAIDEDMYLADTRITCRLFMEIHDMVNEKKHDRVTKTACEAGQEILVRSNSVKMIIPIKEQAGWDPHSIQVAEGQTVMKVTEYRFAYNNKEIARFCMNAIVATSKIMDRFYSRHFAC